MHDTFPPGSDGVYRAQGAVPPHDNVVTERISYRATSDSLRVLRRRPEGPRLSRLLTRGGGVFLQKLQVIATVAEKAGATKVNWRLHFLPPRLATRQHFTKRGQASVKAAARCRAARQDSHNARAIGGNPICIRARPLTWENEGGSLCWSSRQSRRQRSRPHKMKTPPIEAFRVNCFTISYI